MSVQAFVGLLREFGDVLNTYNVEFNPGDVWSITGDGTELPDGIKIQVFLGWAAINGDAFHQVADRYEADPDNPDPDGDLGGLPPLPPEIPR